MLESAIAYEVKKGQNIVNVEVKANGYSDTPALLKKNYEDFKDFVANMQL